MMITTRLQRSTSSVIALRSRDSSSHRGSDVLLAAALGDVALVQRHLDDDPGAIAMRVDQDWFQH
jgi:hypothetical protein